MKKFFRIVAVVLLVLATAFVIFWFARPRDVSFEQARATLPHSEYSHFVDVDGVRLHYQEKGTGVPLLLLHGFTSSTYSWKDVFDPLASNFRVIAVDLKGFGFSAKPDGDYTRRGQAVLIGHLLDQLHLDKVWLCGSSMGGEVAVNLALLEPNRVAGLILIDGSGLPVSGSGSLAPNYLLVPVIGRVLTAFSLTSDKLVREGLRKSFYDPAKITEERVAAYYLPLTTRDGQRAALRARVQTGAYPFEQDLHKITMPTLIIWGAEDQLIPVEAGRKFNELIPGSKLIVFENCGHLAAEEVPDRVVKEISNFVLGN